MGKLKNSNIIKEHKAMGIEAQVKGKPRRDESKIMKKQRMLRKEEKYKVMQIQE